MVFTLWVNSAVSMLDVWRLKAAVFGPCAAGNCHAQPTGQTPLAIDRPAWISAFDILPLISLETKKRLVEEAFAAGSLLITTHAPYPGLGRIHDDDGRRRYRPGS